MVSGIPGGSILPIYDALSQSTQIRHILARHEQGHTDRWFAFGTRHPLGDKARALLVARQDVADLRAIYDALSQSTQIRHILARHEQGAGFIAQGMARTGVGANHRCRHLAGDADQWNRIQAGIGDRRHQVRRLHHRPGAGIDDWHRRLPGSGHLRHLYPHHQT
jgi:hypothetical protein